MEKNKKISKTFTLTEDQISFLRDYQEQNKMRSMSEALGKIIDHQKNSDIQSANNALNKMRLSLSETDTNVQIILEILNTIINTNGYTAYVPTTVYENEILKKARETVKDRIANRKQRKESKKYARKG